MRLFAVAQTARLSSSPCITWDENNTRDQS